MNRIHSHAPIVGETPRLLILGSMPSVESLRLGQYYAHPRNHFWPLIARVCGEICPQDYGERTAMAVRHGIAIWDSVASCLREGSLDSEIKDALPNPIGDLLAAHPSIRTIAFNGRKAESEFGRHHAVPDGVATCLLPSSSPVPRKGFTTIDEKWAIWQSLQDMLASNADR